MKFKISILIVALFALIPLAAIAQQRTPAFGNGEHLTYSVSYKARLIPNIKVAEVEFNTTKEMMDNKPVYHVRAIGKVLSGFKWFFDLNDTYETWLDVETSKPLRFSGRIREGDYRFDMDFVYSWPRYEVYTAYRNLKHSDSKYKTMPLTNDSFDPIALFFNLRNTGMRNFRQGESRNIRIVFEDTIRTIKYTFHGRENKKIGDLGEYRTLKFSCELASSTGESFQDGSELFIWMSDDKNKIPLYLESPIRVGAIKATVKSYGNLKNPMDSKIK